MNPTPYGTNAASCVLPGYEAGPNEYGVEHSVRKLEVAATNLQPHLPQHTTIESRPSDKEEGCWTYRCRCVFQIVKDEHERFHYAMRHQGNPVRLGTNEFPIATRRIQAAMKGLMEQVLNTECALYPTLKNHLTSATFASAWQDTPESDCIITLHYEQPLEEETWKEEAKSVCVRLKLRQLDGRSKKCLICAVEGNEQTIRDTVYIENKTWKVNLLLPTQAESRSILEVHYHKPESAFYHPNAYAMKEALQWMLERLAVIVSECSGPCRLLEMYCGCGAHTVALAKTGLLEEIMAVELDHRLVQACINNVRINGLESAIQVTQGDAGTWAKRCYKKSDKEYHVLLVDPPRAGLDEQVCRMAKEGSFQHFIYISCGHKALLRDLDRLSQTFDVVHCRQLDLFPRTDSIETLVHLKRRQDNPE
jgi:tRNA (uracil-5-)-methyltransferase